MAIAPLPSRTATAFARATGRNLVQTGQRTPAALKRPTVPKAELNPDAAADARSVRQATEIEREIEAQKNSSFTYQLIRTVVMGEKIDLPATATSSDGGELSAPITAEADPNLTSADIAASSTTVTLSVEISAQTSTSANSTANTASNGDSSQNSEISSAASNSTIRSESARLSLRIGAGAPKPEPVRKDPLVLDLDGNGVHTDATQAVHFDLDNDGSSEQINGLADGDVYLALDRNGNGHIDNGAELFGEQNGAANGYAELAKYDDDGNGQIDSADRIYEQLLLSRLRPDGGITSKTSNLAAAGVSAIKLNYQQQMTELGNGDAIAQTGTFTRSDGTTGLSADLLLAMRKTS